MKDLILQQAEEMKGALINHRRWLHAHAATGFDLEATQRYVKETLTRMGCFPRDCGRCGVIADIGTGGKTLLLRGDMDALPMREETGLSYASPNDAMHACGHDLHTAMLLGAARLLKQHEGRLQGRVRLLFQSAEEIFEGARDAMAHGALDGVDAAMMIHVTVGAPLPTGTAIISSPGISAPAADYFTITVKGRACHGSAPQDGVDPITAAAHILIALQELQARELGINDRAVLTIGTIRGGSASNAIADTVTMGGTLRTCHESLRLRLKHRMKDISRGIAAAFRADAELRFESGCPCLTNDRAVSENVTRCLKELLGSDCAYTTGELNPDGAPSAGGSEDFAYISQKVPSVMVALAAGNPSKGYTWPLHHPRVRFDEDVLPVGAAIHAYTALNWLEK